MDCFNGCFPLKRVKIKYRNRKSWLSTGLKKSIKIKNKLYIKSLKYSTVHNISTYKAYRNKLQSLVRKSESEHYDDLLMQNKCNLSKSWKIIKEVINKNKINVKPDKIIINNEPVTDNLQIANNFNELYVNIGHDLSRDIPNIRNDPTAYIPANLKYSMFVSPVTQIEISNDISNLKESSAGHDGIPSKLLKRTCHLLIEPLLHVINLSLLNGVFPDELKIAQVLPF